MFAMLCPNCHSSLADGSQACPYCRAPADSGMPVVRTTKWVRTPTRRKSLAVGAVSGATAGGLGGFVCGLLLDSPAEFVVIFSLLGAGVGAIVGAATQMASEPDYFQRR